MTPFWTDEHLTLYGGDCRSVMAEMPAESVHCVVTSPPYWGLRDYGTATWDGGDAECDHAGAKKKTRYDYALDSSPVQQASRTGTDAQVGAYLPECPGCGATRIDSQLGLEPTPEAYVANMVDVFREVRRVLRADGTLWLNLGDSYASSAAGNSDDTFSAKQASNRGNGLRRERSTIAVGLKPKDLVGIPWRVAFALQADGWYLRSDIIWSKPNPMPESVTDRPTKAHEYLFLLAKSPRYYFDADAVREAHSPASLNRYTYAPSSYADTHADIKGRRPANGVDHNPAGRNLRSVWTIATEPYPGAHFATFPRKLVEPCIKAGTSERGVCPECGAPWVREVERTPTPRDLTSHRGRSNHHDGAGRNDGDQTWSGQEHNRWKAEHPDITTGWSTSCAHDAEPVAAVVLDPFAGSGTTLLVAQALGRRGIGIDLSPEYLKQALARNAQTPLGLVG